MKNYITLLFHELFILLITPASYIASVIFLLLTGAFYLYILSQYLVRPLEELPSSLFIQLYWVPALFVIPLLTMKSIAEERRSGTLQTLKTTSVSSFSIVFSKFSAAYLFYMFLWALTFFFPVIINKFIPTISLQMPLYDVASLKGGYIFLALSSFLFISFGIFTSSLTRSQLVAGIFCFTLIIAVTVLSWLLSSITQTVSSEISWLKSPLQYFQTVKYLKSSTVGIIDSRPFIYYTTNALIFLGLATLAIDAKKSS